VFKVPMWLLLCGASSVVEQVVTPEELVADEDYEEIMEDMREECAKHGTPPPPGGPSVHTTLCSYVWTVTAFLRSGVSLGEAMLAAVCCASAVYDNLWALGGPGAGPECCRVRIACAGTMVNVVIPRPGPGGANLPGVGKVRDRL